MCGDSILRSAMMHEKSGLAFGWRLDYHRVVRLFRMLPDRHAALPSRSSKSSDRPKYSCLAKPPDQELGMAPGDANRISQYRFSPTPRAAMP